MTCPCTACTLRREGHRIVAGCIYGPGGLVRPGAPLTRHAREQIERAREAAQLFIR